MSAVFTVTVAWERESGKFASRDEIVEQIRERIEEAAQEEIDGVGADGDSVYVVTDVEVSETGR